MMKFYKMDHSINKEDIQKFNFENQRIGVIAHIEDENGRILLQQRGVKSRDENGLYEDVGGSVENSDVDFKSAIIREMQEEMGKDANIELLDSTGIYHCCKNNTNWIFVIFKGKYIDGDINIMEPEKCMGYKFFTYEEAVNSNLVSKSCRFLINAINKYEKLGEKKYEI